MFPALIGNMFGCCETQNNSDLNKTEVFSLCCGSLNLCGAFALRRCQRFSFLNCIALVWPSSTRSKCLTITFL